MFEVNYVEEDLLDENRFLRKEIKKLKKENEELERKYTQTLNELEFTKGYAYKLEVENEIWREREKERLRDELKKIELEIQKENIKYMIARLI